MGLIDVAFFDRRCLEKDIDWIKYFLTGKGPFPSGPSKGNDGTLEAV